MDDYLNRERGYRDALQKFNIPFDERLVIKASLTFDEDKRVAD
ncbi:MAG: hypothetical protein UHL07_02135 [Bacteroidaceae bacterium]|nr:hypothetical protein [Bacteroidaceae bacterium]